MSLQEIQVTISPEGEVIVKVLGVKGSRCRELTEKMEQYLGAQVVSRDLTHEYRETEQQEHEERQDIGRDGGG